MFVFALVGIVKIAPERVARDLVVEGQAVVAHAAGAGHAHLGQNRGDELRLGHAMLQRILRRDAGNQRGLGMAQHVGWRLAVERDGLADDVEVGVGADAGKLGRLVALGVGPEGFVVVPEVGKRGHYAALESVRASSCSAASIQRASAASSWRASVARSWVTRAASTGLP